MRILFEIDKKDSIREYGQVHRIQKGTKEDIMNVEVNLINKNILTRTD